MLGSSLHRRTLHHLALLATFLYTFPYPQLNIFFTVAELLIYVALFAFLFFAFWGGEYERLTQSDIEDRDAAETIRNDGDVSKADPFGIRMSAQKEIEEQPLHAKPRSHCGYHSH